MSADTANAQEAYDMIDRYLRNNLDDDAYADYSAALELICATPEGFVLVPIEPTQEMLNAGYEAGKDSAWSYKNCYAAMIAAALQPKEPT